MIRRPGKRTRVLWKLVAAVLLSMVLLTVPAFSDLASAQNLGTRRPAQRGDADSVGFFQMRVGGAGQKAAKTRKLPKTNTLCTPVGGTRPQARC